MLAVHAQVFYKPMLVNKILTEEELNIIFINWKEVRMCNMKLHKWVTRLFLLDWFILFDLNFWFFHILVSKVTQVDLHVVWKN